MITFSVNPRSSRVFLLNPVDLVYASRALLFCVFVFLLVICSANFLREHTQSVPFWLLRLPLEPCWS
ncbi:hypothetical protein L1887_18754 [Cichorium endivia]|nr:hypothetical protein L1887_18754 [Cichorium endivia]